MKPSWRRRSGFQKLVLMLVCFLGASLVILLLSSLVIHSVELDHTHYFAVTPQDFLGPQSQSKSSVIAYAISVSSCESPSLGDGAAVLKHSLEVANKASRYEKVVYAIVHPNATSCTDDLVALGYKILVRDIPVLVSEIRGDFLRTKISTNGCCGASELIKLEAFTLIQHPVVVHIDLDTLVLKPMDDLFDLMLGTTERNSSTVHLMWPEKDLPDHIEMSFTRDYNMVPRKRRFKPVQGGLLIMRPSMQTYNEICELIRIGDYRNGTGWGGKVGPFYGAMTIQGVLPYYYDYIHNGSKSIELNPCVYNSMSSNPRDKESSGNTVTGKCRTNRKVCEDCRVRPMEDIVTFHFTCCQKPWWCLQLNQDSLNHRLCRNMTHEWYLMRSDMEHSWGRIGRGDGTFDEDHFVGYCRDRGQKGYTYIEKPFPNL